MSQVVVIIGKSDDATGIVFPEDAHQIDPRSYDAVALTGDHVVNFVIFQRRTQSFNACFQ